jgi:hypothetical protein
VTLLTHAANFSERLSPAVPYVLTIIRGGAGVRAALRQRWLLFVLAVAAGCGGSAERVAHVSIELFPIYARTQGASVDIFALHPPNAASWMLAFDGKTHPHELVRAAIATELRLEPLVLHSTSWRHDAESRALILTYVAVIAATSAPRGFVEQRVERAPLARGGATTPPAEIRTAAVLSHAMEHLAWLLRVDPAIRSALSPAWAPALAAYVPEPFRELNDTRPHALPKRQP